MWFFDFLNKWKVMTPEDLQGHLYSAISWIHNDTQVKDIKADILELKTDVAPTKIAELKEVKSVVEKKPEKIVKSDNINVSVDVNSAKVVWFKEADKTVELDKKVEKKIDKLKIEKDIDLFSDNITIDSISEWIVWESDITILEKNDNKTNINNDIQTNKNNISKKDNLIVVKDEATVLDSSWEIINLDDDLDLSEITDTVTSKNDPIKEEKSYIPNNDVLANVTVKKNSIWTAPIVLLLVIVIGASWYFVYPKYSKSINLNSIKSLVWIKTTSISTKQGEPQTNTNSVITDTKPSTTNSPSPVDTTKTTTTQTQVATTTSTASKKINIAWIWKDPGILWLFKIISDNSSTSLSELNTNFSNSIDSAIFDNSGTFKILFSTKGKAEEFNNMLKASGILVTVSVNSTLLTVNF